MSNLDLHPNPVLASWWFQVFFMVTPGTLQRFLTQIGTGILQGQPANVIPIAIGATQLVMTSVVSAYNLPVGREQLEAWALGTTKHSKGNFAYGQCRVHGLLYGGLLSSLQLVYHQLI